jgi:hypothetical protein
MTASRLSTARGMPAVYGAGPARFEVLMSPKCPLCKGLGWVCENHQNLAWSKDIGCQCGAGMPCTCNRFSAYEEPDTSGVITEQSPTPRIR